MRTDFLQDSLTRLLGRLSPPRSIAKDARAQRDEIAHLVRVLAAAAPRDGYADWWQRFEIALLDAHQTRAWPTVNEVSKACRVANGGAAGRAPMDQDSRYQIAAAFASDRGVPHPVINEPYISARIVSAGIIPSLREARRLGFQLSDADTQQARAQRPSADEWRHHVEVMARLRGVTEVEAEARERREVSEGQLPSHLARGAA